MESHHWFGFIALLLIVSFFVMLVSYTVAHNHTLNYAYSNICEKQYGKRPIKASFDIKFKKLHCFYMHDNNVQKEK